MVIDPTPLGPLAVYGGGYALLARRRVRGRVDRARAAAFALGLAALAAALSSPLDALAEGGSLSAHMAQHELLANVAPLLLLLGLDAQLARPVTRALFGPALRSARGRRALKAANSPALAVALYVGVTWAWYVPGVYDAVSASAVLHPLGHLVFVATGMLFWFHVLRPLPALRHLAAPQTLAYLLAGTLGGAVVAAVLIGAPSSLYGATLADQRVAGALMMAVEMPIALGAGLWAVLRALPRHPPWPTT